MKPALTHLLAALAGAALVFFLLKESSSEESDSSSPPTRAAKPSSSLAASPHSSKSPGQRDPGVKIPEEPDEAEYERAMLKKFGAVEPTRADLEDYVASRNHSAESLMAAGLILRDAAFLRQAFEKDPDNPQILLALMGHGDGDLAEQTAWRKAFIESDPDNALGSWLLASALQKSGDSEEALDLLRTAANQPAIENYTIQTMLAMEEAYRAIGSSSLGAKLQSTFGMAINYGEDISALVRGLNERLTTLPPGDAEEIRNITAHLGSRLTEDLPHRSMLTDVIGYGVQLTSMRDLPDEAPSPFEGLNVGEANASIRDRVRAIRESSFPGHEAIMELPPETIGAYLSRNQAFGELEALRWLNEQIENR